ncbi:calcium homeostasis endoplasmic reticulum protein [Daphnia magna]|uniref:Calcium homeostasis endoplasmic reticulum protein n=1 Tax=Daphnia magna TaxID=35525 RepID=A0A162C7G0_9CRUS|nr:calcium homeostasis endoplasmic reticulum protein [Daphnia magna]KZS12402.1 Uncharacterized protein APZ42_022523 [Daphnia magna]
MELPRPPEDIELRNIIDKLAQFVARNGPEFEQMTKNKQRDNPKFGFLFGGELFNYYQYRVTTEQGILKQKYVREQSQPMSYPLNYGPPPNAEHPGPGFNRNYNYGPSWPRPHQQPPVPSPMSYPGQNPIPPQTDLVALKGAKDVLVAQQTQLQEQIKQSESNLAAQHQVTVQQQKKQTEETVKLQHEKEVMEKALACGMNLAEFELLLLPIMESCTKESISQGKAWILHHVLQAHSSSDAIAQYLLFKTIQSSQFTHKLHLIYLVNDVLHHCLRKGPDTLLKTLEQVVVHMFSNTSLVASDEEQNAKLQKLVVLWQSKGNLFERGVLDRLHAPLQLWNEYHNSLAAKYSAAVINATTHIQHTYENYRSQHQAFVNHANHQIQQLEQQKLQIEEQIAAAASLQPYSAPHHAMPPDFLSRPPPIAALNTPQKYPSEGIEPKAPYFDLPAGLLVPLVKMEDSEYKSIDPKDIRLPAPLPPSERLIAAIDFFYSPLSHDRPRNADGWEQMALFEFYKNKAAGKKKKEDDIAAGLRELSPPPTPIEAVEESSQEMGGKNGLKSPVRRRFRSESPEEELKEETRRARSRSGSPRGSQKRRRSRSNSESPRRTVRSTSPTPTRSESRSNSPVAMTRFQPKRSPTPPSEMASLSFAKGFTNKLDENNRGHQLLCKMGWGGAGLGANEQGIAEPIKGGEARDRVDQFKGVGINIRDPFENFRKSKGQAFITRMRSRAEEREKEKGDPDEPPTP